jgi:rhodanese-related sulfurtransferase
VELLLSDAAAEFVDSGPQVTVRLRSGRQIDADLVILSVGVRPENQLAVDAGLDIGPRGGIAVNQSMQTSDPDIYAVGDATQVNDFMTGGPAQIPLAGPANRQGRLAADHIFGRAVSYRGTQGTSIVGLFGMAAALTGMSEKALVRAGLPFAKAYLHAGHHAGYYPGAETMSLKVLFDPESGRILGAQAVGGEGVDKRIDVFAIAIQARMSVFDLEQAELAYAPQFGSAKDPVNMAGFIGAGMLRGDHPQVAPESLVDLRDVALIDVRTPEEHARGTIPGARNIPLETLRDSLAQLDRGQPVVVFCQVGQRGYMATRALLQRGYQVRNLSGGYLSYLQRERARQLQRAALPPAADKS